jgi:cell division inhibitor SepF
VGLGDLWNRTLVYFGIAEDEEWDEDGYLTEEELERSYSERPNVRRLSPRRRPAEFEDWTDPGSRSPAATTTAPRPRLRSVETAAVAAAPPAPAPARVHLLIPRSFNDAQALADRFKSGIPVILNLQATDAELSKRLMDFASGLTYALGGGMQRVADKVFLLTPLNVQVSAEERARILDREGLFEG